jgi:hypothetical protein
MDLKINKYIKDIENNKDNGNLELIEQGQSQQTTKKNQQNVHNLIKQKQNIQLT